MLKWHDCFCVCKSPNISHNVINTVKKTKYKIIYGSLVYLHINCVINLMTPWYVPPFFSFTITEIYLKLNRFQYLLSFIFVNLFSIIERKEVYHAWNSLFNFINNIYRKAGMVSTMATGMSWGLEHIISSGENEHRQAPPSWFFQHRFCTQWNSKGNSCRDQYKEKGFQQLFVCRIGFQNISWSNCQSL